MYLVTYILQSAKAKGVYLTQFLNIDGDSEEKALQLGINMNKLKREMEVSNVSIVYIKEI